MTVRKQQQFPKGATLMPIELLELFLFLAGGLVLILIAYIAGLKAAMKLNNQRFFRES